MVHVGCEGRRSLFDVQHQIRWGRGIIENDIGLLTVVGSIVRQQRQDNKKEQ